MYEHMLIVLVLLAQVILDATGDAHRARHWTLSSHIMEAIQVGAWIAVWALFSFEPYFILMYILGRVWAFDLVYNLWVDNSILYMGESDMMGRGVRWFAGKVKQNYIHFSLVLKVLSLIWWVAWLLTK